MNNRVVAIIQARMESSRLPGKVLMNLAGKPTLQWMIDRCNKSKLVDDIYIATTTKSSNKPIYETFGPNYVFQYMRDEDDVIGRVLACARYANAGIIVDLTGDCPMADPSHIDSMIEILIEKDFDYVSNCVYRDWPDGLDIQVYKTETLEKCIKLFHPKQHAGWNIAQHSNEFKVFHWSSVLSDKKYYWPKLELTLDTPEDYNLLNILFEKFGNNIEFCAESVIDYMYEHPELCEINKSVRRKTPEEG